MLRTTLAAACILGSLATTHAIAQEQDTYDLRTAPHRDAIAHRPGTGIDARLSYETQILVLETIAELQPELAERANAVRESVIEQHSVALAALEEYINSLGPEIAADLAQQLAEHRETATAPMRREGIPKQIHEVVLDGLVPCVYRGVGSTTALISAFHPEYQGAPEKEFIEGVIRRRQFIDTTPGGYPTVTIDFPRSWRLEKHPYAERLQVFRSRGGYGHESLELSIFTRSENQQMEDLITTILDRPRDQPIDLIMPGSFNTHRVPDHPEQPQRTWYMKDVDIQHDGYRALIWSEARAIDEHRAIRYQFTIRLNRDDAGLLPEPKHLDDVLAYNMKLFQGIIASTKFDPDTNADTNNGTEANWIPITEE